MVVKTKGRWRWWVRALPLWRQRTVVMEIPGGRHLFFTVFDHCGTRKLLASARALAERQGQPDAVIVRVGKRPGPDEHDPAPDQHGG
ncbi:hypothetical protein K7472_29970 [Streptomyces sp. PTM05]|uniref:Uncharacterized protein n=1 Tax=Streptantibioticus parmotrematis TaxID=2873249 RepID=A0ABS7R0Q1_9ACTN|nr:hypothetical protein [Streptantibioticus parmotrematis]MBY8889041.1 hypothetical protein [Streptantibioticus parmotrematis]